MKKKISVLLVGFIFLSHPAGFAADSHISNKEKLSSHNVNLNGKDFMSYMVSRDDLEREKALIYLLGVLDSTEGRSWCDFQKLKSISLQEYVYSTLKTIPTESLDKRAAFLIEDTLKKTFPCKKENYK